MGHINHDRKRRGDVGGVMSLRRQTHFGTQHRHAHTYTTLTQSPSLSLTSNMITNSCQPRILFLCSLCSYYVPATDQVLVHIDVCVIT